MDKILIAFVSAVIGFCINWIYRQLTKFEDNRDNFKFNAEVGQKNNMGKSINFHIYNGAKKTKLIRDFQIKDSVAFMAGDRSGVPKEIKIKPDEILTFTINLLMYGSKFSVDPPQQIKITYLNESDKRVEKKVNIVH